MRHRLGLFLIVAWLSATALPCAAEPDLRSGAEPRASTSAREPSALEARVLRILASAGAEPVRAPAELAKLALARARRAAGDADQRRRCLDIAEAALALAERRAELLREQSLHAAALVHRRQAEQRSERAVAELARLKPAAPRAP